MLVDTTTNFPDDKRIYLDPRERRVFYRDTNLAVNIALSRLYLAFSLRLSLYASLPLSRVMSFPRLSRPDDTEKKRRHGVPLLKY